MLNNSSITDQSTSQGGLHKNEWISTVSKESKNALFKGPHNNSKLFDQNSVHSSVDEVEHAGDSPDSARASVRFPTIRDTGMFAASRDRFQKQIQFIKIQYNYEKYNKMSEDAVTRRAILVDLMENYPEIEDVDYDTVLNTDLVVLHEMIEKRKIECRMEKAATILQRAYRNHRFRDFCFQKKIRRNKAAKKLQAQWKVHRQRGFRDGIANHGKYLACVKIQKHMKGYLVAKRMLKDVLDVKLYNHIEFFD